MQHTLKPYLINAFYIWSLDIGFTPIISVAKWSKNLLPEHLIHENTTILKIHPKSVKNLVFAKDTIEFEGVFNMKPSKIIIHHESINCIYNLEDEYGLDFDVIPENSEKTPKKPKLVLVKNEDN